MAHTGGLARRRRRSRSARPGHAATRRTGSCTASGSGWRSRTARPVGRGGLNVTFLDGRPEVEVGWAVGRENWGRGIATEIARASLDEAGRLGLRGVVAFSRPENHASLRVIEKSGLARERELDHAGRPHILFRAEAHA